MMNESLRSTSVPKPICDSNLAGPICLYCFQSDSHACLGVILSFAIGSHSQARIDSAVLLPRAFRCLIRNVTESLETDECRESASSYETSWWKPSASAARSRVKRKGVGCSGVRRRIRLLPQTCNPALKVRMQMAARGAIVGRRVYNEALKQTLVVPLGIG